MNLLRALFSPLKNINIYSTLNTISGALCGITAALILGIFSSQFYHFAAPALDGFMAFSANVSGAAVWGIALPLLPGALAGKIIGLSTIEGYFSGIEKYGGPDSGTLVLVMGLIGAGLAIDGWRFKRGGFAASFAGLCVLSLCCAIWAVTVSVFSTELLSKISAQDGLYMPGLSVSLITVFIPVGAGAEGAVLYNLTVMLAGVFGVLCGADRFRIMRGEGVIISNPVLRRFFSIITGMLAGLGTGTWLAAWGAALGLYAAAYFAPVLCIAGFVYGNMEFNFNGKSRLPNVSAGLAFMAAGTALFFMANTLSDTLNPLWGLVPGAAFAAGAFSAKAKTFAVRLLSPAHPQ